MKSDNIGKNVVGPDHYCKVGKCEVGSFTCHKCSHFVYQYGPIVHCTKRNIQLREIKR